jgi:hypothetical protein
MSRVLNMAKPIFTFFKLLNCPACEHFEAQFFQRLIADTEIRNAVNLDQVIFGRDRDGTILTLEEEYPDLATNIRYAPYLWLSQPYDETTGYHLNPSTQHNRLLNTRLNGMEFSFQQSTTYEEIKRWILEGAYKYRGFHKAARK